MDHVTLERYWNDASVKAEIDAAARRERARVLQRFLSQAAQALLGDRHSTKRARPIDTSRPCEVC